MNKWLKAAIIIPVVVFVLIVVSYFILRTGLGRSLPQVEGELNVNGTNSPVEIFRGEYGIPLIYGENEEDAAFALGFVHAQDRLFQMDLMRRAASGRISEGNERRSFTGGLYVQDYRDAKVCGQQLCQNR